jgi:hypothetical protein
MPKTVYVCIRNYYGEWQTSSMQSFLSICAIADLSQSIKIPRFCPRVDYALRNENVAFGTPDFPDIPKSWGWRVKGHGQLQLSATWPCLQELPEGARQRCKNSGEVGHTVSKCSQPIKCTTCSSPHHTHHDYPESGKIFKDNFAQNVRASNFTQVHKHHRPLGPTARSVTGDLDTPSSWPCHPRWGASSDCIPERALFQGGVPRIPSSLR